MKGRPRRYCISKPKFILRRRAKILHGINLFICMLALHRHDSFETVITPCYYTAICSSWLSRSLKIVHTFVRGVFQLISLVTTALHVYDRMAVDVTLVQCCELAYRPAAGLLNRRIRENYTRSSIKCPLPVTTAVVSKPNVAERMHSARQQPITKSRHDPRSIRHDLNKSSVPKRILYGL